MAGKVHTIRNAAAAAAPAEVTKTVQMRFKKSTPGTHVYETDADDALCTQVYLKKAPMGATGEPPKTITLSVTYTA